MKKLVFLPLLLLLLVCQLQAQRIKLVNGSLSALAGQQSINVVFHYNNMRVGKFDKEANYVNKKVEEYNKKEAGRGDNWAKAWVDDRAFRFEPKFNELFTKSSDIQAGNLASAKYTLVVNTTFTEPGFNVGVWRENASINATIEVVETSNMSNKIGEISMEKALGRTFGGYDFDTGLRIMEAYADGGKALGKFVKSKSK
jgi:hypothetical protein